MSFPATTLTKFKKPHHTLLSIVPSQPVQSVQTVQSEQSVQSLTSDIELTEAEKKAIEAIVDNIYYEQFKKSNHITFYGELKNKYCSYNYEYHDINVKYLIDLINKLIELLLPATTLKFVIYKSYINVYLETLIKHSQEITTLAQDFQKKDFERRKKLGTITKNIQNMFITDKKYILGDQNEAIKSFEEIYEEGYDFLDDSCCMYSKNKRKRSNTE